MSASWSLCCETCQEYSESYDQGKDMLKEVVRAWPQIKALLSVPALFYVDVYVGGASCSDAFSFLDEHAGHTLVLESEYGRKESLDESRDGQYYRHD